MKEMLFITVAILVPPTLTFLGVVGDTSAPRAELTWHAPTPAITSAHHRERRIKELRLHLA